MVRDVNSVLLQKGLDKYVSNNRFMSIDTDVYEKLEELRKSNPDYWFKYDHRKKLIKAYRNLNSILCQEEIKNLIQQK